MEDGRKVPANPQRYRDGDIVGPQPLEWVQVPETDAGKVERMLAAAGAPVASVYQAAVGNNLLGLISSFGAPFIAEDPLEKLASLVVYNQGGLVVGCAGTGKSLFRAKVEEKWRQAEPETRFLRTAPTHVAAKLIGGGTIDALTRRNKYNRMHDCVLFVDEVGMVSIQQWERLARWSLLGARFVLFGDFEGQFLPIGEDPGSRYRAQETRTLKQLANCLCVRLSQNRRGSDPVLFQRYSDLYPFADAGPEVLRMRVVDFQLWYPYHPEQIDLCVVLSHRKRILLNRMLNMGEAARREDARLVKSCGTVKGFANQPQDMLLWPGQELIGCSGHCRKVVNGVVYVVKAVTEEHVVVDMHPRFRTGGKNELELALRHADASATLRLSHAVVYYTSQGRTIPNTHLVLLDTLAPHFTGRHLIVGASRVTDGRFLHVPTVEQQAQLLARARDYERMAAAAAAAEVAEPAAEVPEPEVDEPGSDASDSD